MTGADITAAVLLALVAGAVGVGVAEHRAGIRGPGNVALLVGCAVWAAVVLGGWAGWF